MSTSNETEMGSLSSTSLLFARGVVARLALWPALRIAVEQNWGGPESAQKRTWLASVLVDAFEEQSQKPPDTWFVEETLLQAMADEFEAVLEDDSAEAVAKDVVKLWAEVSVGKNELVRGFEEQAEKMKGRKIQVEEGVGSDDDWDDDEEEDEEENQGECGEGEIPRFPDGSSAETRKYEPEVDEDGFTIVKSKGKGRR